MKRINIRAKTELFALFEEVITDFPEGSEDEEEQTSAEEDEEEDQFLLDSNQLDCKFNYFSSESQG